MVLDALHALADSFAEQPADELADHIGVEAVPHWHGCRRHVDVAFASSSSSRGSGRRTLHSAGVVSGHRGGRQKLTSSAHVLPPARATPKAASAARHAQGSVTDAAVQRAERRIAALEARIKQLHHNVAIKKPSASLASLAAATAGAVRSAGSQVKVASAIADAVTPTATRSLAADAKVPDKASVSSESGGLATSSSAHAADPATGRAEDSAAVAKQVPQDGAASSRQVAVAPEASAAAKGDEKPRPDVAECHSKDGRYVVKVASDGQRSLIDSTSDDGRVLSRVHCDGDVPKSDGKNCNDVSWPCKNIHRPEKGYIEDVVGKVKPLCQHSGWHALLVGLGGGQLQSELGKVCAADARIDTVESSPSLVPIAKNIFGFEGSRPKQRIEFGVGVEIMKGHAGAGDKYDFIFTDRHIESSKDFIGVAHKLLRPEGRLAFSQSNEYQDDFLSSMRDFFTPVKPSKMPDGTYTLLATPKILSKEPALAGTEANMTPEVQAQATKPKSVEAAKEAASGSKAAQSEDKTIGQTLQVAQVPESKAPGPAVQSVFPKTPAEMQAQSQE